MMKKKALILNEEKREATMKRSEFLKWMGASSLGLFFPLRGELFCDQKSGSEGRDGDFIEEFFRESLIIDGTVNLGMKRGRTSSSFVPGEIKRKTGINVGGHTTRITTLKRRNQWLMERQSGLLRIDRASDIEAARKTNRYGIIYFVQSGFDLRGSIEPLAEWKEDGIRIFQLTYSDNELGGGSGSDELPLTVFGKKVVQELNRLRMVVDVSHCGKRTTLDAAEESSHPITANHANAEALAPVSRNKSDEELQAIAQTGGVIGVTTINRYLLREPTRPASVDDFVAHIDYIVEKIGVGHVGVGSDCYMDGTQRYEVDFSDKLINSPERWKHIAHKLHERGYKHEDLKKIFGLNFKRIYDAVFDP